MQNPNRSHNEDKMPENLSEVLAEAMRANVAYVLEMMSGIANDARLIDTPDMSRFWSDAAIALSNCADDVQNWG